MLVSGPAGVGKATLVRAVCAGRRLVELDGPDVGALAAQQRLEAVADAVATVRNGGGVLLITDIDALLPAGVERPVEPVATLILAELRTAVATPGVAFVATSQKPDALDPRLRSPELCDRELGLSLPDAVTRKALLEVLLRNVPAGDLTLDEIAERTPGFVGADLAALVREAALRAAARASADGRPPALAQDDFTGALTVIRPLSRSATEEVTVGGVTLDDVGDMAETKQALTEAVLWPLRHPDTFSRLGIQPPRGVLLYGPPGCGKTFVVRALASSGRLSVHAVKGAELMDKWVGASEKAVRDLFRRARDSAPSLVFLDEIDALAPRRGQSFDSGVTDRVVAALLTELDGIDPLRDVVVLAATNRPDLIDPALLRPGRLERLVFVAPPDAEGRLEILRTASKSVPLADDVDLDALAGELDGIQRRRLRRAAARGGADGDAPFDRRRRRHRRRHRRRPREGPPVAGSGTGRVAAGVRGGPLAPGTMLAILLAHAVAAAVAPLLVYRWGRLAFYPLALVPALSLIWVGVNWPLNQPGDVRTVHLRWVPELSMNVDLRFDALSAIMAVLVLAIGALVLFYCAGYFHHHDGHAEQRLPSFAAQLVAFSGAMFGLVVSDNLLLLYLFWELTTVLSFALVAHYAERASSRRAAMQALLVTTAGGLAMLTGIIVLGHTARHLSAVPVGCPPTVRHFGKRRRSRWCWSAPSASRRWCPCISGCPAQWRRPRPSARTCTPPRWSRPASIWWPG